MQYSYFLLLCLHHILHRIECAITKGVIMLFLSIALNVGLLALGVVLYCRSRACRLEADFWRLACYKMRDASKERMELIEKWAKSDIDELL